MNKTQQPIAWSSYHHAYGPAKDTPKVIESLKSVDPAVRENALDHLAVTIYHQGDIYTATAPAVEALIRLVANEQIQDRSDILGLVEAIAGSAAWLPGQFVEVERQPSPIFGVTDPPDYSLNGKTRAETGFREVLLPVQVALASQRALLENLLGDQDRVVAGIVESILDISREFPYSNCCDPVYRNLEGTEYGTVTAFASAHPTMTFRQLASRLGKRIPTLQVWWALLTEAHASGNVEAFARGALVREIHEHTRGRGWDVSIHFHRIYERMEASWLSRFSDYREQSEAVWALLVKRAEKGWLPQSPDDSIIRACFDDGWRKY